MPYRSRRQCTYPGCHVLVQTGSRCADHVYEREIKREPSTKKLYNSKQWKEIRAQQLAQYPYCKACYEQGRGLVPATEVDHVIPHRGDETKFFAGPFDSLCKSCHSTKTMSENNFRRAPSKKVFIRNT